MESAHDSRGTAALPPRGNSSMTSFRRAESSPRLLSLEGCPVPWFSHFSAGTGEKSSVIQINNTVSIENSRTA